VSGARYSKRAGFIATFGLTLRTTIRANSIRARNERTALSRMAHAGNPPAPPDPGSRSRRYPGMGAPGRRDDCGAAQPVCAIRCPGVSSPGAERGGARLVLRAVRTAGTHGAERLGLACDA